LEIAELILFQKVKTGHGNSCPLCMISKIKLKGQEFPNPGGSLRKLTTKTENKWVLKEFGLKLMTTNSCIPD
jgi:hypothetical protein